ncbi:hypothetical protein CHU95_17930 [Niveispirillum lacus]|uniref:Uncharacterized protein n=1 Tax=Niveispirillum lacus TaxID=1981099 RepID=A0A255YTY9_9PROT|nr:hypothetical protein [Niveispirillum lacus]OYQ32651.1 hypothetical protein CHU95_17930 [Niveispirillum lacus]
MPADPQTPLSFTRLHLVRTAGGAEALRRGLAALSDADVQHLARSLEFQGVLEGAMPDLLSALRPRLRQVRPERVGSVERMCWRPLERFLTDQTEVVSGVPWIVPRRLLRPLWALVEAANADLVDQLRRRHLTACFDQDQLALDQVAHQITDLAAFILNNAINIPARLKLSAAETAVVRFMARVLKWHRLVMPNVRYFQQAQARQTDQVQALRLYSNWYSVFELLDTQFDLYVLHLFEMTPNPVDVIDAFPFYFDTMTEPSGLALQWLHHRLDNIAADTATLLARPPRIQPAEVLLDLSDRVFLLNRLATRLRRIPLFGPEGAGADGLSALLRGRLGFDSVERLGEALIDWLHDVLMGPADKRIRAINVLGPLAGIYPLLLLLIDTGERASRAHKLRIRLGDKAIDNIDRYLRSHEMAPQARHTTASNIAPVLEMCRAFGKAEAVTELERRLRR